jgi:hypothetical protein
LLIILTTLTNQEESTYHHDKSIEQELVLQINSAVIEHLTQLLGASTLDSLNFHLGKLTGADLAQVATQSKALDSGLRVLFGKGAKVIIRASLLPAFRAAGFVPDREFEGLEEGIRDLQKRLALRIVGH